jgi:chemotaxis protein CheD
MSPRPPFRTVPASAGRPAPVDAPSSAPAPAPLPVLQGEFRVSDQAGQMFTTILGSCVATCISDPVRGIGGMNHFLLPGDDRSDRASLRYGVNAMELMINALLKQGARRERLEAKLFGGARMLQGLHNIGRSNADFALWFLEAEKIRCVGQSLGGERARKLRYWPHSGQVQQQFVEAAKELLPTLAQVAPPRDPAASERGGVTLF